MEFELRPALEHAHIGNEPILRPTGRPEDFAIYVGKDCYGNLWKATTPAGYSLSLALPGHDIEYSALIPSKDAALKQIAKVLPLLVGNPAPPLDPHSDRAAKSALYHALEIASEEGDVRALEFLRIWSSNARGKIREQWPFIAEDDDIFGT